MEAEYCLILLVCLAASPQDGLPRALYSYLVGVYQTSVVLVCTGTLSNMLSVCVAGKER